MKRVLSRRVSEALGRELLMRSWDRPSLFLSAKAKQAGLRMIEAYGDGRFPREQDVLTFWDEADPARAQSVREITAKAEQALREMELESLYGVDDNDE